MGIRVLLSDFPWWYSNRRATRRDNPSKKNVFGMGADKTYEERDGFGCIKTKDIINTICPLIDKYTMPDCYHFMWATLPLLPDALEVMKACGFKYSTTAFIWTKLNKKNNEVFYGAGNYTFSNVEVVLLGTKGRMWHPKKGYKPHQEVRCPRPMDPQGKAIHSRKPDEVQDRIDQWLVPHLVGNSMCEIFATRPRDGWVTLGGALSGRDIKEDLIEYGETNQTWK